MYKILSALFFIIFIIIIPGPLRSQILPKEGSKLNYRLIGFSFPTVPKVSEFTIEISAGNYKTEDSFKQNIIQTLHSKNNEIIAEVPSFGRQYTWRTVYSENSIITKSELHHFNTSFTINIDTQYTRLKIIKSAAKYKDAYIFLDGSSTLYDMDGRPVWFLPDIPGINVELEDQKRISQGVIVPVPQGGNAPILDLKLSPFGTITFLIENKGAYEINYKGAVLWKAPNDSKVSGSNSEFYHHEFTRLSDGHYMVLGTKAENVYWRWKRTSTNDSIQVLADDKEAKETNTFHSATPFGTLIEYDERGKVIWSWNSSKYFVDYDNGKDLYYCRTRDKSDATDVHENAFFFDEKDSVIYVSFKNVSRVIKIQYPTGKILNAYGDGGISGMKGNGSGMFCYQHSCRRSDNGYLYLYNNNLCHPGAPPSIVMMQEPLSEKDTLKKIWEYKCEIEKDYETEHNVQAGSGGNVIELPDRSILACTGMDHSKILIVGRDKKILWSAFPEKWDEIEKKWYNIHIYRASIILNRKEMEKLIWNGEKND